MRQGIELTRHTPSINDNAALGRKTDVPGVESEELETQPMLVEGLVEEGFKAVRVAAGDSVSLAISDQGELRCWGSFRVRSNSLDSNEAQADEMRRRVKDFLDSMASRDRPRRSSSPSRSRTSRPTRSSRSLPETTTFSPSPPRDRSLRAGTESRTSSVARLSSVRPPHALPRTLLTSRTNAGHKTHGLTPERLALKNIVLVGSGSYHSFAVDKSGAVYAWGLNSFRQTGVSDDRGGWEETITSPTLVDALHPDQHDGARVVQITGGVHHSLFLLSNGQVWACGRCDGHEVGLPSSHPAMKESAERETEAKALRAIRHTEVKTQLETEAAAEGAELDGDEAAFKAAEAAAQGIPLPNPYIPLPTLLSFPLSTPDQAESLIIQIAAGTRHNFAVSASGEVFSWGVGNTSQLGLGDEEEAEVPTKVKSQAMGEYRVLLASTGGQHSVVVAIKP